MISGELTVVASKRQQVQEAKAVLAQRFFGANSFVHRLFRKKTLRLLSLTTKTLL